MWPLDGLAHELLFDQLFMLGALGYGGCPGTRACPQEPPPGRTPGRRLSSPDRPPRLSLLTREEDGLSGGSVPAGRAWAGARSVRYRKQLQ